VIAPVSSAKTEAVFEDPRPVGDTVVAAPRQGAVFEDGVEDHGEARRHEVVAPIVPLVGRQRGGPTAP
jgi:hypothetical protein